MSVPCYGSLLHHPSKKMTKGHFGNTVTASDIAINVEQISQGSCSGGGNQFLAENSEKKFYKCCNCGTAFVHKEVLEQHLKLMCGKTHWHCPYCSRTARVKAHLKQHITQVHTKSAQRVKQRRSYIMFK